MAFWILLEREMMGWQRHQLDHMQIVCTLLHTEATQFLQARCPSCHPAISVKVLKAVVDTANALLK